MVDSQQSQQSAEIRDIWSVDLVFFFLSVDFQQSYKGTLVANDNVFNKYAKTNGYLFSAKTN